MKQKFDVTGMTCSAHVEKAVCKLEGVRAVQVNLLSNSMQVEYDEGVLTPEGISAAVDKAGYGARPAGGRKAAAPVRENPAGEELAGMKRRMIASFCFLIPLFYISMGHMLGAPLPRFLLGRENAFAFAFVQLLLTLPILYINDKYFKVGFKTLFHGAPNMDTLIAVGSSAAVIYGVFAIFQIGSGMGRGDWDLVAKYHMDLYFESAGMILTLITLGKFLETRSKGKTSQAISRLMDLPLRRPTWSGRAWRPRSLWRRSGWGTGWWSGPASPSRWTASSWRASPLWTSPPSPASPFLWTRARGTRWLRPRSTSRASSPLRPAGWGRTLPWPR